MRPYDFLEFGLSAIWWASGALLVACGSESDQRVDARDSCEAQDGVGADAAVGARSGAIIGGAVTMAGEWPWLLHLTVDGRHQCGAALVAPQWALTAAHCIERAESGHLEIVAGDYDSLAREETEQRFELAEVLTHPARGGATGLISDHDVALVRLDRPVAAADSVSVISLLECGAPESVWLAGWGGDGALRSTSDVPLAVRVPVLEEAQCAAHLSRLEALDQRDQLLCVGGARGDPGACHSDSGGPVTVWTEGRGWQLAGITVGGGPDCDEFTLVADVLYYHDWIFSHVEAEAER